MLCRYLCDNVKYSLGCVSAGIRGAVMSGYLYLRGVILMVVMKLDEIIQRIKCIEIRVYSWKSPVFASQEKKDIHQRR